MTPLERLDKAIDSLTEKALNVKRERDDLLEAAKGVWKLLEDGALIRDTTRDYESDWALKQIPVVRALAALDSAIARAEGREP